jgi:hypothetical protein
VAGHWDRAVSVALFRDADLNRTPMISPVMISPVLRRFAK